MINIIYLSIIAIIAIVCVTYYLITKKYNYYQQTKKRENQNMLSGTICERDRLGLAHQKRQEIYRNCIAINTDLRTKIEEENKACSQLENNGINMNALHWQENKEFSDECTSFTQLCNEFVNIKYDFDTPKTADDFSSLATEMEEDNLKYENVLAAKIETIYRMLTARLSALSAKQSLLEKQSPAKDSLLNLSDLLFNQKKPDTQPFSEHVRRCNLRSGSPHR